MRSTVTTVAVFVLALAAFSHAADSPKTVADALTLAANRSTLTTDGSPPFHLKVKISEPGQSDSDYVGSIDLVWVNPNKWHRTIESPDFSQTAISNGDAYQETDHGDYFPLWLRNLVRASTDPVAEVASLRQSLSSVPFQSRAGTNCNRMQLRVGIAPAQNNVFFVICFTGDELLESVTTPGFSASFKNYKGFGEKKVAREISEYLEPGVTVVASVTTLETVANPDESLFAISSAAAVPNILSSVLLDEATARNLLKAPPNLAWPGVRGGKTSGVMSIYLSADRAGHVRETYPLNSDNPALDDPVRSQILKWELKPATVKGVPVQVETILTFNFDVSIENAPAVLSDTEARKQAITAPDPLFPAGIAPSGTVFTVRVSVNEQGKVAGLENIKGVSTALVLAVNAALHEWKFRPYLRDGKPDIFKADLLFRVP